MDSLICGAINRKGMRCRAFVVAGGKRCRNHGGWSTGPRTPSGRARCAENMRRVRIKGPGAGHRKTDKTRKHREAMVRRRKLVEANQARRTARWELKKKQKLIAAGIPLVPGN